MAGSLSGAEFWVQLRLGGGCIGAGLVRGAKAVSRAFFHGSLGQLSAGFVLWAAYSGWG